MTNVPGWTDGLPYLLFRTNQAVQRMLAESVSELGVTITQLGIAVHIDQLGHLSGSDLARHFGISPQAVSTALGHLESSGWVERVPHPVHKRVIWYRTTSLGEERVKLGRARLAAFETELAATLGAQLAGDATTTLSAFAERLLGPEPRPGTLWPVPGVTAPGA